jgi:hypothetical protein
MPDIQFHELLCALVHLPQREGLALRILTDGEVAHARHSRFGFAESSTKFLPFRHGLVHARNGHIDCSRTVVV